MGHGAPSRKPAAAVSLAFRRVSPAAFRRVLPLLLLAAALVAGCGDPGEPSSLSPTISATPGISAARELELVQAAFGGAVVALQDGDLTAWRAALPVGAAGDTAAPAGTASPSAPPASTASPSAPPAGTLSPSAPPARPIVTDVKLLREDLDEVLAHLAPLGLRAAHAVVRPVPGRPHFYLIRFTALMGRAGPADRILAERILKVHVDGATEAASGGSAAGPGGSEGASPAAPGGSPAPGDTPAPAGTPAVYVVADDTPPEVQRESVMAFNSPRALIRDGLVLVYERAWRLRAAKLAPLADAARAHVADMYGVDAGRAAVVFLYASRDQVIAALAAAPGQVDPRIKYFSHPALRVAARLWSPTDVGVIAPALNGIEGWAPYMLQHEVAHAYTLGWFFDTAHAPDFLEEGLAVAAEESHDWTRLKAVLTDGELDPPLDVAIALGDIWAGRDTENVRVLYSAGGSLVDFILQRWGRGELRRWVRQLADSDLSREAIAAITRRRFGVGWPAFQADWRAYVEQL